MVLIKNIYFELPNLLRFVLCPFTHCRNDPILESSRGNEIFHPTPTFDRTFRKHKLAMSKDYIGLSQ